MNLEETQLGYLGNSWKFCRDLTHYRDLRFDPHYQMCDFLQNSPGNGSFRWSNIPSLNLKAYPNRPTVKKRKLLLAPRSSFKSTIGGSEVIRRQCLNPRYRALIVGYNAEGARDRVAEVSSHWVNSEDLRALFGDLGKAGRKMIGKGRQRGIWSKDNLQLWDPRTGKLVEMRNMYNVRAVGLETGITRMHPDLVWVDDSVCAENSETLDGLDSVKAYLKNLEPLLDPGTELWVSGTRWDIRDAYGWIMENPEWDVYCASAINPDHSLWFPEKLSWEFLKSQERAMGTYKFSCQYLNNPIHPKDAIFQEDWIKRCIVKRSELPAREQLSRKLWVDPSCSAQKGADHTGMLVTGMDNHGVLWCLDSIKAKMQDTEIADRLASLCKTWDVEELVVEEVAAQVFIKPLLDIKFKELGQRLHYTGYKPSTKRSKEFKIRASSRFYEAGRIRITDDQIDFLDQLGRYQARQADEDHLLDCGAMATEMSFPSDWHEAPDPIAEAKKRADSYWRDTEEIPDNDLGRQFQNVFA